MSVNIASLRDQGWVQGIQRPKLCVFDFFMGSGNHTEVFPHPMRELFFSNDHTASATIQLIGPASLNTTFVLLPGETIDERINEFTSIVITATGDWRFYPRSAILP